MSLPTLKNINEFPSSIQSTISEFANKLIGELGDNILSIFVYGSAAGINYHHGISNINVAVVLKNLDFSALNEGRHVVKWGHKHKIATPLFLTREYLLNSLDVFPIEYSEMKQQHRVVYGEDIFDALEIPTADIRLLCEQQVKGKLLRLRQAYLEIGPQGGVLKKLLQAALNDLVPAFRQLLILKDQHPSNLKEDMFEQLAKEFSLDVHPFLSINQDKHQRSLMAADHVEAHFQNFLVQLENLSARIDSL